MNIPKRLWIGAHHYQVKIERENALGSDCLGKNDRTKNTITIDAELADSQKGATLFHEILHALNSELEEKEIEYIAQGLYAVLERNRMLR